MTTIIPPPVTDEPPWLAIARGELGVRERLPNGEPNPRIHEYFQATGYKGGTAADAWCSAWLCWVMEHSGVKSTRKASARSWLEWGVSIAGPRLGCVAVYSRGGDHSLQGHVGLWMDRVGALSDDVMGGNELDMVRVRPYPRARLLGYRWLAG